jgi:hypothetical protein
LSGSSTKFQHGIRAGEWSGLMAPQVADLTQDDMIAIAAYAATLDQMFA